MNEPRFPLVTVLIMSHRPAELPLALQSVFAQTFTDYQVLVNFCGEYWPNKMNDIAQQARGRYLVPLCDDDQLAPTFLERHVEAAETTNADLVYSDIKVIGEYTNTKIVGTERTIPPLFLQLPEFDAEVLRMHCVPFFTALIRRTKFEDVGGYDGYQPFLDHDLWLRLCQADARYVHLRNEYLFWPKSHTGNSSRVMDTQEAWRLLRRKHSALILTDTPS